MNEKNESNLQQQQRVIIDEDGQLSMMITICLRAKYWSIRKKQKTKNAKIIRNIRTIRESQ